MGRAESVTLDGGFGPVRRYGRLVAATGAFAGGLLHAAKGLALLTAERDPSFVPAMITLFAAGLVGLGLLLSRRVRIPRAIGLGAAVFALLAGLLSLIYQASGIAPEHPGSPMGVQLAYAIGTFGILIALIALGIGVYRSHALPAPWHVAPIVAGLVWFPLEAISGGWGLFFAGISWLVVAYCIWLLPIDSFDVRAQRDAGAVADR